jgi:asparagine synthase (glutamine-hydrolysing)
MLAVPPEQHFQPHPDTDQFYAGSKRLVRRGLRGILPEQVRTLTVKTGFGSVFTDDVARNWPVYEQAFGLSSRPYVVERGYVDQRRFLARLEQLRDGGRAADFIYVIRVLGLETWLRGLTQPRADLVSIPTPWRRQAVVQRTMRATEEVTVGTV